MNITGGKYKGQKITAPDENITRPTLSKVRMSVFNTLQAMVEFEGLSFLKRVWKNSSYRKKQKSLQHNKIQHKKVRK